MDNNVISPILQAKLEMLSKQQNDSSYKVDLTQKEDVVELSNKKAEEKETFDKKIKKIVATSVVALGTTATAAYCLLKGKNPTIRLDKLTSKDFEELKLNKFTGKIKGQTKTGKKLKIGLIKLKNKAIEIAMHLYKKCK